ncbi:uncharacterized protein LOC107633160 isoform X1 [Arachis ipaensis]|uniref:uncharacterized protein LOC107633160 isoform X1 n=1 Tax=Arachis ipaensis TaxID=130454 RepID=UPI0007AF9834|nr:uncharacterized protein LOC107633160 isoform X1 [Arachis ipaensis]XP_016192290.1 uncharacterized protein LOC107633160 isoform X1 [Arachis ipaensis]XP_016192302.1 uncharacterized protein LOC107633160 isoform X1 [Arachis ipaensis]XP_016192310.1 uncharacterized protein LOC107633160 isoform X1 [Arachis ipaensis]XP_016192323.1 uncharacterized protein LOC107633160 isoform X1 [Arachis ipaensis]XP_016192329.1 uncharacterized protein LOC107633160 isoform X1 [Arachis ipaensis]XP_020979359.1 uncharac
MSVLFRVKLKLLKLANGFSCHLHLLVVLDTVVYIVEFQKRGLPHYHILLFIQPNQNPQSSTHIDQHISAEIPDEHVQPKLHKLVQKFIVHGPCQVVNTSSPCMVNEKCSKFYPLAFRETTVIVNASFPKYKRPDNGRFIHDSAVFVDEIQNYYDCRYISACEAFWRLFGFEIQFKQPSIIRLPFHLPNEQHVLHQDHQLIENVIDNAAAKDSMFIGWMRANKEFDIAHNLTFVDMPTYFVWNKQGHIWKPRKQGHVIGRLTHIPQSHGKEYYLRLLLNYQKGCESFADI